MIFGPCIFISFLSLSSTHIIVFVSALRTTSYLSAFTLVGTMSNCKYPAMYSEKEAAERNAKKAQTKKEYRERIAAQQQCDMLELAQRRAADANKCKFGTSPLCTFVLLFVSLTYPLFGPSFSDATSLNSQRLPACGVSSFNYPLVSVTVVCLGDCSNAGKQL